MQREADDAVLCHISLQGALCTSLSHAAVPWCCGAVVLWMGLAAAHGNSALRDSMGLLSRPGSLGPWGRPPYQILA